MAMAGGSTNTSWMSDAIGISHILCITLNLLEVVYLQCPVLEILLPQTKLEIHELTQLILHKLEMKSPLESTYCISLECKRPNITFVSSRDEVSCIYLLISS